MSQRDLVAELRAAHVAAPPEVRERVRLVAASAPTPARRFTWRRALVVAVPVAAAIAASIVFTRPSQSPQSAGKAYTAVLQAKVAAAPSHSVSGSALRDLAVPPTRGRVQVYGALLALRVPNISDALKQALHVAASLSGYPVSVHAETTVANVTLKIPRAHVQQALARLSKLGTITSEQVDIADKQAGLNATDRLIARLQTQLKTAPPDRAAQLSARIAALQRAETATRRAAHFATIRLQLATPRHAAKHHGHGPLHGLGVAFRWLGIGAVYALALGAPVLVVLALAFLALRLMRRRREDALLSSR